MKSPSKYNIKESKTHGKGVFATSDIKKGELIGTPLSVKYNIIVDITPELGQWLNHSWSANSKLVKVDNENKWNLVATSSIKKNEEISMDYRETPWFIAKPSIWYK